MRKPLVSQVKIDGRLQNIEYEDLPMICYQCGRYRHISELCKNKQVVKETVQDTSVVVELEKSNNSISSTQRQQVSGDYEDKCLGPWMHSPRRIPKKANSYGPRSNGDNGGNNGNSSWFGILSDMGEEDLEDEIIL